MPEDVAEPGAGDQQHGVGDHVPGDHQLQAGAGGVQVGMDRGGCDVNHGGVEDGHELPGQDHREGCPRGRPGLSGPAGRLANDESVCHDIQPAG